MSNINNGLGVSADFVDWSKIPNFGVEEFAGQTPYLDAAVVYAMQKIRDKIGAILISPASGAIARRSGNQNTMHYADLTIGRLSLAIDWMPLDVDLKTAYEAARSIPEIGGVGVYPDWRPMPGLHTDLRLRKSTYRIAEWSGFKTASGQVYKGVGEAFS